MIRSSHKPLAGALSPADLSATALVSEDRRRERRFLCGNKRVLVNFSPTAQEREWRWATMVDGSARGIQLVTDWRAQDGTNFMLKVQVGKVVAAIYTVRHAPRTSDGQGWLVGAEFLGVLGSAHDHDPEFFLRRLLESSTITYADDAGRAAT